MRVALALVLFLSGVKLLEPPGANAIVLVVAAVALVSPASPPRSSRARPPPGASPAAKKP